jgi:hypothetical protein
MLARLLLAVAVLATLTSTAAAIKCEVTDCPVDKGVSRNNFNGDCKDGIACEVGFFANPGECCVGHQACEESPNGRQCMRVPV